MCAGLFISPVAEAWQLQAGQASLPATGSGATFVAVSFGQTYPAPPVVVTLIGRDDTAPAAVRIRNVTPSGFELVQVEPGGANGDHGAEVVHWLAVEQGQHVLADGTMIEAGTINTMAVQHGTGVTGTESWQSLSYGSSFAAPPVLLTELQSMNNEVATLPENPSEPWLVVGVRNVTTLGAQVALERCESAPGSVSVPETIGYVAVEAGRTGTITADDATEVAYETLSTPDSIVGPGCVQMTFASTFPAPPLVIGHLTRHDVGDGGWLRRCARTATDVTLVVDEDQYRDSERNHGTEAAGLLLFERAFVAEIGGGGPGLPVVALASVTASVDENGGSVNITIVLSATSDSDVTVDCATADLTANGGSDFVPLNEPVTIPSGQISGVVTVSIADDLVAEGTEDFLVSITNPIGATLGTPESTTVTIVDNEPVPTVAFFTAAQPVDENAGSIGLTVVVSGPSSHDISVDYTTLDGTALSGSDYVALSDTLVIAAGQTSGLIPVTITDDAVAEGTEYFTVRLTNPSGATLGGVTTATVAIMDDEAALPAVGFAASWQSVGETDSSVTLLVQLSATAVDDVSVNWATANGTATAGQDYVGSSGVLTILSGDANGIIEVPVTDDSNIEGAEDFIVTLGNPVNAVLGAQVTTTVTIADDDATNMVSFANAAIFLNEHEGPAVVDAVLDQAAASEVAVRVTAVSGTAISGQDFVAFDQVVVFAPGQTSQPVIVDLVEDFNYEPNETFDLVLGLPTGPAGLGEPSQAAVTIYQSDWPPFVYLADGGYYYAEFSGSEGLGQVVIPVRLHLASGVEARVDYYLSDGTAQAGIDYIDSWGTLVFAPGEVEKLITIPILADETPDDGETFEIGLYNEIECTLDYLLPQIGGVTLYDDRQLAFTAAEVTGIEATGSVQLTVSLNQTLPTDTTIEWRATEGTAEADADYFGASGQVTIPAFSLNENFYITIANDGLPESDETFFVTLFHSLGAALAEPRTARVVIADDNGPRIRFDSMTYAAAEDAGLALITVSLSSPLGQDVWVDSSTADGTAREGEDYLAAADTLFIPSGSTTGAFVVTLIDDEFAEGDETVELRLSNSVGVVRGVPETATLTIHNDDELPSVSFTEATRQVSENDGTVVVEAVLSYIHNQDIMVDVVTSDGSAVAGLDYVAVQEQLTIPSGEISGVVSVPITDDFLVEGAEDFSVTISNPIGATLGALDATTVTIVDNDPTPTVTFAATSTSIDEAAGTVVLAVELSEVTIHDVTVDYTTVDGTAVAGGDYVAVSDTLTIPAGELSGVIPVTIIDDATVEGSEHFSVGLSAPMGAILGVPATAMVIVTDDEATLPAVRFAATSTSIDEAAGTVVLAVELSEVTIHDVTVDYTTVDGTAVAGGDYVAVSDTLTIPAGELSGVIPVTIIDDATVEGSEHFSVGLSAPVGAILGVPATAMVIVTDDEATLPAVGFAAGWQSVGETESTVTVLVQLSAAAADDVSVSWATANDTATAGQDYVGSSGVLTILSGDSSGVINVAILDDTEIEGAEDFTVTLSSPVNAVLGAQVTTTVTIADDDATNMVSFANAAIFLNEHEGPAVIDVVLDQAAASEIAVRVTAVSGTAVEGEDFVAFDELVVFSPGQTSRPVIVDLVEDFNYEPNETFDLVLGLPTGPAGRGEPSQATVTIYQSDWPPFVYLADGGYDYAEYSGSEAIGQIVIPVRLHLASGFEARVDYYLSDGTAQAGIDYVDSWGTLVFAPGEVEKLIAIPILADGIPDDGETFEIELYNEVECTLDFMLPQVGGVTLYDDRQLAFTAAEVTGIEATGSVQLTVSLNQTLPTDTTIEWRTTEGTAEADADYFGASGQVTIPAFSLNENFSITIADDGVPESDETFFVTLFHSMGAALAEPHTEMVVIAGDNGPRIRFDSETYAAAEDAGLALITVSLSSPLGQDVWVDYATADGTATEGEDYLAAADTLFIPFGSTTGAFVVSLIDDEFAEGDETVELRLSNSVGVVQGVPATATLTIVNDDEVPTVSLSSATLQVAENDGSVVVAGVLSYIHNQDILVDVATSNGSAVAGLDYVAVQEQLTIPSGEISGSVSVPITDDVIAEGPEEFSVAISNPVNAALGTQTSAIVTITDNEPLPSIAFSSSEARTAEVAGVIELPVQISGVSSHDITVHYATADGTAMSGSDYVAVSDTLTIPAGELSGVIQVTIIDDGLPEDDEAFTVTLSAPVGALLSSPDTANVTIVSVYPIPIITEPVNGAVFYGSYGEALDASSSVVPPGFEIWFAALVNDGSSPMVAVYTTDQLTGSFTANNAHPSYRVRLVIAASGTMPADPVLRGLASPCNLVSSGYRCDTAEVTITRFPYVLPYPFETVYALPEGVFLRWGQRPNVQMERSADGGVNWTNLGLTTNDDYYFKDTTISEGVTYHYRARPGASSPWVYLGSTLEGLGDAVSIPEWNAPRIIPQLDNVTWHCPQGALRYLCDGTLHMRLQTETGRSLSEATIRVFLNEETFQLVDGNGGEIHTVFDTSGGWLHDFVGYDLPGCVVRKATPDLEVQVPYGEEEIAVDLPGIVFGANGLRFDVEMPNGDISERAILIAVLDEPVQEDHRGFYGHFEPVLFGSTLTSSDPELWGVGPVSRHSPDCKDGDSWYYFDHWPDYITALFFNQVDFGASTNQLVFTDDQGVWTHTFTGLTDGIHALRPEPPSVYPPDGSLGRAISNPATGYFNEDYAHFLSTESYGTSVDITIDSAYAVLTPQLSHVEESIVIDSADPIDPGVVRFRMTDADQNLDMATVRAYNCSLESCIPGQPGQTPYWGFYANNQWGGDDGHYGWFVVELPLTTANDGVNELVFCASDALGNALGAPTDPCVSAIVTRESPLVYASITEPQESPVDARPGAIIELDGSASVFPSGGVGVWTIGLQNLAYYPWYGMGVTDPANDPSGLHASTAMPTGPFAGYRARLIVAATPGDLPTDYWPDDGSLPCVRSAGGGRCDSADVTLRSTCTYDPSMAGVVMDSPSGFTNVAPDETLQLAAHVASPPLSPFAYRWVVYSSDDVNRRWPIVTLGYGDAGEGFSTQNNDLLISPASYGLEPGDYTLVVQARYPASGCASTWYFGASAPLGLRVGNTLDGVAPGMVVEGASFRVYSQTWAEGVSGVVFIDDNTGDANPPLAYEGIVQAGGYIEITPDPLDLPAIGSYWFVSVADDLDGTAQSSWVNALQVEPAGDAGSPLVVSNEEDTSCGGAGTECAHPILPAQTWQGEWGEAADQDGFTFLAGAGTEVAITLNRVDLTLPPQHPDSPAPEIHLAGPDGVVHDVSEPLALDATGTSLTATITTDGRQTILVRTSKGTGEYLVTLDVTAEGGSGQSGFGFTPERVHLTTEARPDATLSTPLLDPFGNPITGARVSWEQGAVCGVGDFCGNGTTMTVRSSTDGFAMLEIATAAGADPLWKPSVTLAPSLKQQPVDRPGVAERLARARAERPILGVVRTSGRALGATNLTDPATAAAIKAETRQRALARGDIELKDGTFCSNHTLACPSSGELVFRAAQLALDPGDDLIDVEVRILDGGTPTELLDGHTILEPIPLTLEIEATVRDAQSGERQVMLTEPAAVTVSDDTGGAIFDGIATCGGLEIPAGGFTYLNGPHAGIRYTYDEPDGSPCCWQTTELLQARVVVDAEVDDGQGGTIRVTKRAEALVESRPRPADPCEIRPWPPGFAGQTPLIAGTGPMPLPAGETSAIDMVGEVYTVDACGNINYLAPTDPQITVTGLSPQPPDVWAEVAQSPASWAWYLFLRSLNCTSPPCDPGDLYFIPDGLYDISLGISGASSCDGGGTPAYVHSVDYAASRPVIQLKWEQGGDEPVPPIASPGSALRNPATGELIAWRVRPGGPIRYTDVPVRLYVADTLVYHDSDGNIVESFRKVDDAEICVGEVRWHYDPDACPDPGCNVRTVTCDQVFTGETTVLAYTEPEWSGGYFDGPIGVAAGVSKVPDQAGSYYLIAEPLDEAFRRGDAWMVATEVIWTLEGDPYHAGTYRKAFEVGGGLYLDENMRPFTEGILVGTTRQVFVKLYSGGSEDPLPVDVSFVVDGAVQSSVALNVPRVGATSSGQSVYLGDFELHVPSAGAKSIGEGPQIEGTGTLISAVNQVAHASQLASEVWVEVEQVLDKDDNDVTGTELDVKQMAPLTIRYRIKGTDQHVGHSLTVLEFAADESNEVHTDFYGGSGAIVSDVVDESPDVLVNGFYGTAWEGRDNTGDDRILLQGVYRLSVDVSIEQSGAVLNAITKNPVQLEVLQPHASNYGQLYPIPQYSTRDCSIAATAANGALAYLEDGTSFTALTSAQNFTATSADALNRAADHDAVFSFSGHGGPGILQFYSDPDPQYDPSNISNLSSNPVIDQSGWPAVYVADLEPGDLGDVYLTVLLSCRSGLPPEPEHNLSNNLIAKGVDMSIAFPGEVHEYLANSWAQAFWDWAAHEEYVPGDGAPANIYNSCRLAAAYAISQNPGLTQDLYDTFENVQIYVDTGVSSTEYLRPARHGKWTN